jgi:uncharacterized membrane protein (DUF485 family)
MNFMNDYKCVQPVFYLGSSLTSLSAIAVFLARQNKLGKLSTINVLVLLAIYLVVIYLISHLINWLCVKNYPNAAWVVALLPILNVLLTIFE